MCKTYKDKKKLEASLGKNRNNYEEIRNETSVYDQKPIKVHDFNEIEEKQIKELVEKRKQKRREVAENNKLLKKKKEKKKEEEDKQKEKAMWKRLGELNQEFKDIKEHKKKSKKMSKSILKT